MNDQDKDPDTEAWRAGETFFEKSGGAPAIAAGGDGDLGVGGSDAGLPASEAGASIIPEDASGSGDVHRPASEADTGALTDSGTGPTQSWPGKSFGSIPPPG